MQSHSITLKLGCGRRTFRERRLEAIALLCKMIAVQKVGSFILEHFGFSLFNIALHFSVTAASSLSHITNIKAGCAEISTG